MGPLVARATVRAEVKRARRDGRAIDRRFLRIETGEPWHRLERLIAEVARQVSAAPAPLGMRRERGGEGSLSANRECLSPPLVKRWRKRA